jgi:nitroreductase
MLDLLRSRRSIRKYGKRRLEPEKVELMKEAVLRAPSGKNSKSCEFVFVNDSEIIEKLSESRPAGSQFLAGAPMAIVILGDEARSDTWVEDCSIAAALAHCAAHAIGLGSCWIQVRNRPHSGSETAEDYIRRLLNIPDNLRVLAMIAVGYPGESKPGHPEGELDFSKIKENSYR